jgi:hypothetical protein
MANPNPVRGSWRAVVAAGFMITCCVANAAEEASCESSGEYHYLCGLQNAEDLVQVPGTHWIVSTSLAPGAALYLIDAANKTWSGLYASGAVQVAPDLQRFPSCPGAPALESYVTHGLNLQPGKDGHSTLYVVGHGGREGIEVYDVDATGGVPVLTWVGCVLTEGGLQINSVASLRDGTLLATVPLRPGVDIPQALDGRNTGAVFRWSPGDKTFTEVAGTDLPYPNGIEVSLDEQEFFVASSGLFNVTAYSNTNPATKLRQSAEMAILPDNLHRDSRGQLITGGLNRADTGCGSVDHESPFSLEVFAACPRPFTILSVDPQTLAIETIATGPANASFSNITMAVSVGDELWIGTFTGDRVAYTKLANSP